MGKNADRTPVGRFGIEALTAVNASYGIKSGASFQARRNTTCGEIKALLYLCYFADKFSGNAEVGREGGAYQSRSVLR